MSFLVLLHLLCLSNPTDQPIPDADTVLVKSIAYHDPSGLWENFAYQLGLEETRPDGTIRELKVTIDRSVGRFIYDARIDGHQVVRHVEGGRAWATLDGEQTFSEEDAKRFRITPENVKMYRNYYLYLYGLPMKLRDEGTRLDPTVTQDTFQEQAVLRLKVTYEAEVGKDTWYFYFKPDSFALIGCRFFHDESKNDGEYIVFEGEYQLADMRIPATRHWYTNQEQKFLGTDKLVSHQPAAE